MLFRSIGSSPEDRTDDVKAEFTLLKKYVEKARLKDHYSGLVQEAKDELRRFRDMEGEAQADDVLAADAMDGGVLNGQVNGDHV